MSNFETKLYLEDFDGDISEIITMLRGLQERGVDELNLVSTYIRHVREEEMDYLLATGDDDPAFQKIRW